MGQNASSKCSIKLFFDIDKIGQSIDIVVLEATPEGTV